MARIAPPGFENLPARLTVVGRIATVLFAMLWTSQRKSPRFHIAVSVTICGEDRAGTSFEFEAWTHDVSAEGACVHVPPQLWLPRRLHIVADDYQFQADADVDVIWERTEPQRAIGVQVVPGSVSPVWQAR